MQGQGEGLPGRAEEVRHVPLLRFDRWQFVVGRLRREEDKRMRAGRGKRGRPIAAAAARLGRPGDDPNRGERLFLPEGDRAAASHLEQG